MTLRAAFTLQELNSSVTHVVLGSDIAYIELVVAVSVDNRGLFRLVRDAVAFVDSAKLDISKKNVSPVSTSDKSSLNYSTGKSDEVQSQDQLLRTLIFIRKPSSQATASDLTSISSSRVSRSSASSSDLISRSLSKIVLDGFGMNDLADIGDGLNVSASKSVVNVAFAGDATAFNLFRFLNSSFGATDSTVRGVGLGKSETIAAIDSLASSISKALSSSYQAVDSVAITWISKAVDECFVSDESAVKPELGKFSSVDVADSAVLDLLRLISDGVGVNDSAETDDGLLVQSSKTFANAAFLGDSHSTSFSTNASSVAEAQDAGVLSIQGYCDPTYFAEDYVGEARVF
jgi:hypothetical protein